MVEAKRKTLTRRELYDLAWSKPMQKLAEEFGLSDRGLAKICQRHRVPVPSRGYWAKLAAGQKVRQTRFHEVDDPQLNRVEITGGLDRFPPAARKVIAESRALKKKRSRVVAGTEGAEQVPIVVEKPHRLLAPTVRSLRKGRPDGEGARSATGPGCCGVVVHADRAERAISILDFLLRRLVEKGLSAKPADTRLLIELDKDNVGLTLRERTRRVEHQPTEAEVRKHEAEKRRRAALSAPWSSLGFGRPWPEYDTVYTGQLVVALDGWSDGLRRTWADGKTQRLEGLLDQVVTGIEARLEYEKVRREEREERERQWKELERRKELARRRHEREENRIELLAGLIRARREADEIRTWLSTIGPAESPGSGDLARMVKWARSRLASLEQKVSAEGVSSTLSGTSLFPEADEFHDPLGDPPRSPWERW